MSRKGYIFRSMYQLPVGQFKSKFSEVLDIVLQGGSVGITYGKNKKKVAALVPYKKYAKLSRFTLDLLKDKAAFTIHKGFKVTDEALLQS